MNVKNKNDKLKKKKNLVKNNPKSAKNSVSKNQSWQVIYFNNQALD